MIGGSRRSQKVAKVPLRSPWISWDTSKSMLAQRWSRELFSRKQGGSSSTKTTCLKIFWVNKWGKIIIRIRMKGSKWDRETAKLWEKRLSWGDSKRLALLLQWKNSLSLSPSSWRLKELWSQAREFSSPQSLIEATLVKVGCSEKPTSRTLCLMWSSAAWKESKLSQFPKPPFSSKER